MKKGLYIILIIIISALFSSCKKDLVSLNKNPNDPTWVDAGYVFKQALKSGAGSYNSNVNVEQWGAMNWSMYIATRGGVTPGDEYMVPSGKDAFWNEQFTGALMSTQQIINLTKDTANFVNLTSAARIWKVFLFHRITDLWGEIPYTEALKGYSDLNYAPKYNTQKEIYYHMLKELKEASNTFDSNLPFTDQENDLIYSGNIENWKIFANSLRLRLATHIKNVDHAKYQAELLELQSLPLINSAQENALFPFNSQVKNHIYAAYYTKNAVNQNNPSHFFVQHLKSTDDPRITIFLDTAIIHHSKPYLPAFRGVPNLLENTNATWDSFRDDWTDASGIGSWFLRANTPGVFMSYSEVCFLKAEAALDGYWSGSPESFLKEGINANIDFYELYGDEKHKLETSLVVDYVNSISNVDLEEIITQKWISFAFENGYEAYTEYRRTGYPSLTDYNNDLINMSIFPNRMPYPSTESSLNSANYSEANARQGADNEFTKLWWDVN